MSDQKGKQRYQVTAPTAVLGHEPGKTFERKLDPAQEARLLGSGALKKVRADAGAKKASDNAPGKTNGQQAATERK